MQHQITDSKINYKKAKPNFGRYIVMLNTLRIHVSDRLTVIQTGNVSACTTTKELVYQDR